MIDSFKELPFIRAGIDNVLPWRSAVTIRGYRSVRVVLNLRQIQNGASDALVSHIMLKEPSTNLRGQVDVGRKLVLFN